MVVGCASECIKQCVRLPVFHIFVTALDCYGLLQVCVYELSLIVLGLVSAVGTGYLGCFGSGGGVSMNMGFVCFGAVPVLCLWIAIGFPISIFKFIFPMFIFNFQFSKLPPHLFMLLLLCLACCCC